MGIHALGIYILKDFHITGIEIYKKYIDINTIDFSYAFNMGNKNNIQIPLKNLEKFMTWIIKEKGFNEDNIKKSIKIITSSKC